MGKQKDLTLVICGGKRGMLKQLTTKEKFVKFIREYFVKDSGINLTDETSFLDEGILDSTGVMELVAYIETEFRIGVADEDIIPENLDSINNLVSYVNRATHKTPSKKLS
jgi:acyl carrier protein